MMGPWRKIGLLFPLAMAGAMAPGALGQTDWQSRSWEWRPPWDAYADDPWRAQPLDAGFEDVGPAGASLRDVPLDPRSPTDFQQVFRMPDGSLMRQDGGIRAVFPRSAYVVGNNGPIPEIPAGTVFHVGGGGSAPVADRGESSGQSRGMDLRMDVRLDGRVLAIPAVAPMTGARDEIEGATIAPASICSSESYRRARLASLLSRAAGP